MAVRAPAAIVAVALPTTTVLVRVLGLRVVLASAEIFVTAHGRPSR